MVLKKLIDSISTKEVIGTTNIEILGITDDSRKVEKGYLFFARRGISTDSHEFIPQVVEKGAVAIIGEQCPQELDLKDTIYAWVENSRLALGIIASVWFDNPSQKLKVIGITGTEGKTTTSNLLSHILNQSGYKTGLISTIGAKIGDQTYDTGLHVTNPDAVPLQELLAKMAEKNCQYAVLETTSIGIDQERVAGVSYFMGVLTNITHDHLDYHKTIENYKESKAKLFRKVGIAILNKDDSSFEYIKNQLRPNSKCLSYSIRETADFQAENICLTPEGTEFDVAGEIIHFKTQLLGLYNVSNSLAAIASARTAGIPWKNIQDALSTFQTPEGRLEIINLGQNFNVFVDFAHTPNALEKVLQTLKEVKPKDTKLIAVYGAAGERDAVKRPAMGKAGAKFADITIFTEDDPRSENVDDIIKLMEKGAIKEGAKKVEANSTLENYTNSNVYCIESKREKAIRLAMRTAQKGDTVVLLGKGHEKSLAVKGQEIPWSDQKVAKDALSKLITA